MRAIALAGFVVAALVVALYVLVGRDSNAAIAVEPTTAKTTHSDAPSAAVAVGEIQPRSGQITRPTQTASASGPAPSLQTTGPSNAAGTATEAAPVTPEKRFQWKLWQGLRRTETAVIDCIDAAKSIGARVDGTSVYGVVLARKGDQVVVEGSTFEYGPYTGTLQSCLQGSANDVVVEYLPDGVDRIVAYRKITVENGEITLFRSPGWDVQQPAPAPTP